MKSIIAVDIDEVVVAFAEPCASYVSLVSGVKVSAVELYDGKLDGYSANGLPQKTFIQLVQDYISSNQALAQKPLPGAVQGLNDLAEMCELFFITSRDQRHSKATKAWFEKHMAGIIADRKIVYVGNHYLGTSVTKADYCTKVGATFLVDDQIRYVDQLANSPVRAILFGDYEWNADVAGREIIKASDWPQLVEIIRKEISYVGQ